MAAQDNDIKNKRPDALMVDEIGDLSEEDIERMLQNNSDPSNLEDEKEKSAADEAGGDVLMELLENADDAELNDIHSMLQKSDNNQAIDSSVEDLIRQSNDPEDMVPDLEAQEALELVKEMTDPKEFKKNAAAEKRRLKLEKQREAKRLKEEKRKEKEERKGKKSKRKKSDDIEVMEIGKEEDELNVPSLGDNPEKTKRELEYDENMVIPQLEESNNLESQDFDNIVNGLDKVELNDVTTLFEGQEVSTDQLVEQEIERFQEAQASENGEDKKGEKEKKGFFARLFEMLTKTPEEEENETGELNLSDENEAILKELDEGKKGKKKKEKGKKKDKKGSEGAAEEAEGGEGGDDKKGKKEKKKKPKKEKPPKVKEVQDNGKKLPKKGIIMILAFCISLGAVIFLINLFISDHALKKVAKNAFYNEDYQVCYQNLYGKKRNDSEDVMFHKSQCIMKVQIWINEYENLMKDDNRLYALDRLLEAVKQYPDLYRASVKWNVVDKVSELYQRILDELDTQFGLNEEQAQEIVAIKNDVEYTKKLREILNNPGPISKGSNPEGSASSDQTGDQNKDLNVEEAIGEDPQNVDKAPTDVEAIKTFDEWIPAVIDNKEEKLLPQDAEND